MLRKCQVGEECAHLPTGCADGAEWWPRTIPPGWRVITQPPKAWRQSIISFLLKALLHSHPFCSLKSGFVIQDIHLVSPHNPKRGVLALFISWPLSPMIKRKQKMAHRTNKRVVPRSFNHGPVPNFTPQKLDLSPENSAEDRSRIKH